MIQALVQRYDPASGEFVTFTEDRLACVRCEVVKFPSDFRADKRNPNGKQGVCKSCENAWQRKRRSERVYRPKVGALEGTAECRRCRQVKPKTDFRRDKRAVERGVTAWCKPCHAEWSADRWANDGAHRVKVYRSHVLKVYGLTGEALDALLIAQAGRCATCSGPFNPNDRAPFSVDHDHETGAVRGLLCRDCNTGLGMFHDSVPALRAAIEYLEASRASA